MKEEKFVFNGRTLTVKRIAELAEMSDKSMMGVILGVEKLLEGRISRGIYEPCYGMDDNNEYALDSEQCEFVTRLFNKKERDAIMREFEILSEHDKQPLNRWKNTSNEPAYISRRPKEPVSYGVAPDYPEPTENDWDGNIIDCGPLNNKDVEPILNCRDSTLMSDLGRRIDELSAKVSYISDEVKKLLNEKPY